MDESQFLNYYIESTLEKFASIKILDVTYQAHSPWYNNALEAMKRKLRRLKKYIIKPILNSTIMFLIQFANNIDNY